MYKTNKLVIRFLKTKLQKINALKNVCRRVICCFVACVEFVVHYLHSIAMMTSTKNYTSTDLVPESCVSVSRYNFDGMLFFFFLACMNALGLTRFG